jgi:hypothetical protein
MPTNLLLTELKAVLSTKYSSSKEFHDEVRARRKRNIESFLGINRDGLEYGVKEHRILLYTTLCDEKIYIQTPGSESIRNPPMLCDFRPIIQYPDGATHENVSFKNIWDVLDVIGKKYNEYLSVVATILLRMGYMYEYRQTLDSCICETIVLDGGRVLTITKVEPVSISWYRIDFSESVWFSLNNYLGVGSILGKETSFEGFIKLLDLILQNEDCKYYYRNVVINRNDKYDFSSGQIPTCNSNLLIVDYLKGNKSISALLQGFIYGRGVAPFNVGDYQSVTDDIVTRE